MMLLRWQEFYLQVNFSENYILAAIKTIYYKILQLPMTKLSILLQMNDWALSSGVQSLQGKIFQWVGR